jgi:hypothetical protein
MNLLRKFLAFLGTVTAIGLAAPACAAPEMYILDHGSYPTSPGGWFIYDRDASTLIDYSITFDQVVPWPTATFTFPAANIVSATSSGFAFSDETTAVGLGDTFAVHLGSFTPWFAPTYDPATVTFIDGWGASDSTGTHSLLGTLWTPIYYEGQLGGGIMVLFANFYDGGPVVVGAIPEPETYVMLVAGLGLLGFTARRRKLKETAAA